MYSFLSSCATHNDKKEIRLGTTRATPVLLGDGRDIYTDRLRSTTIEVAFAMEDPPDHTITHFELWCIFVEGSAIQEYVATLNDISVREWTIEDVLLPIGIKLPYYLFAILDDGSRRSSTNAYYFTLTKPPVIQRIDRIPPDPLTLKKIDFNFEHQSNADSFSFYHQDGSDKITLLGESTGEINRWTGYAFLDKSPNKFYMRSHIGDILSDPSNTLVFSIK